MYLVRIKPNGMVDTRDDAIHSIPEWKYILDSKRMGERVFTAIALYEDYESPFRFREDGKDREKAIALARFQKTEIPYWNEVKVKEARAAYRFLQRDPIREHLKSLEESLKNFDELLTKKPNDIKEANDNLALRKKVDIVRQEMYEVRAEIAEGAGQIQIKGKKVRSWLEVREFELDQLKKMEEGQK